MLTRLGPTEAANIIIDAVEALPEEDAALLDALGRVSASQIASPIDLPHWDNSAMDGYAVRGEDVAGKCPIELDVVEQIPAGGFPQCQLSHNQCARIFTGARAR